MSLQGALAIATGGLDNISYGMAALSQNIANASTPQYALETATQTSVTAGGQPDGVASGITIAASDPALQNQVAAQTSSASEATTISNALSTLQPVLGSVGSGNDLGSQLTNLQSAFSTLLTDPGNTTQQSAVVSSASSLASGINALAASYGQATQSAQNSLVSGVAQLNTALATIGTLNTQIILLQSEGVSTADLQNQMSAAENSVSQLVDASFVTQTNGSVAVITAGGAQLPTTGSPTLSIDNATTAPSVYYPGGGLPGIMLGSTDITSQITGGSLGANITLRDSTLPSYQASLDEFSEDLSKRFAAQGLTLFTDSTGTIPQSNGGAGQSGYVGYSETIQVNPTVLANPSLVRDGTNAVTGSATGASAFTPNPSGGDAGFTTLINRILTYGLGDDVQAGVSQTPMATTGLGNTGTLSTGFGAQTTLTGYANALTAAQSADSASATSQASDATALQTSLQSKLTTATGVDLDTELGQMVTLQNAYGANAHVISAIETVFTYLMDIEPTT
jgi:flagellar hook-associated protein 1 FlgK